MGSGLRTLLFDLDGTLIDSEELILASYRHTIAAHLGTVPPDSVWKGTMGMPLAVQLEEFARDEQELDAMVQTYVAHNRAHHDAMVRPFPGISKTLARLRAAGVPMAVVTSKRAASTRRGLERCGIPADWFGAIVTADDVSRYKPDPEPVLVALAALEEPDASRALFVGDSAYDVKAGRAAGAATAAALWGPYTRGQLAPTRPDYWLAGPAEIPGLLAGRVP